MPYIPIFITFILDEAQKDAMRFKLVSFGNQAMGPSGSDVCAAALISAVCAGSPQPGTRSWGVRVSRPVVTVPGPVHPAGRQASLSQDRNLTPWARSQDTSLLAPANEHCSGVSSLQHVHDYTGFLHPTV